MHVTEHFSYNIADHTWATDEMPIPPNIHHIPKSTIFNTLFKRLETQLFYHLSDRGKMA